MPPAAEQECKLAQHGDFCGRAVLRDLAIDERACSHRRWIASFRLYPLLCEVQAAPGRSKRKPRGEQHAIGDLTRKLEHLRSGRCDIDWILPALIEYHLRTAQLVQRALIGDRLTGPQRPQRLDVFPHDPDRFDWFNAGFAEVENIADRHVENDASPREFT